MGQILLPETIGEENGSVTRAVWTYQPSAHCVSLKRSEIARNLVKESSFAPQGVADPWSPARAFHWRLATGDRESAELLRLVLVARFLDLLSYEVRSVDPRQCSQLEQSLSVSLPDPNPNQNWNLVLFKWTAQAGSRAGKVVAGSLTPHWTLFPATNLQSPGGVDEIRGVLARSVGTQARNRQLLDADYHFCQESIKAEFCGMIAGLAMDASLVDQRDDPNDALAGAWRPHLIRLAGGIESSPNYHSGPGLIPTYVAGAPWECERCKQEGAMPWKDNASLEIHINRDSNLIVCQTHYDTRIKKGEAEVTIEDLGVTVLPGLANQSAELIIWEDTERDPNVRVVQYHGRDGATLAYGQGPRFNIRGRVMSLGDVTCPSTIIPRSGASPAPCTIPIASRFLDLIDLGDPPEWVPADQQWRVNLRGRRESDPIAGADQANADQKAGIVVWPRQAPSTWNAEVVSTSLHHADKAALAITHQDGHLELLPFRELPLLQTTENARATFVAYRDRQDQDLGAVQISRSEPDAVPAGNPGGFITIDLGTSNSVVHYIVDGDQEKRFVRNGSPRASDSCRLPYKGSAFLQNLERQNALFSGWFESPTPKELMSTLLIEKTNDSGGVVRASVVPRTPRIIANFYKDRRTRIYADLKWAAEGVDQQGPMTTYIKRIVLPALHALSVRGVSNVTLAATYPLAFNATRKAIFDGCINRAVRELMGTTGMTIAVAPNGFISESEAGIMAGEGRITFYSLTIDMGGGTTDYALLHKKGDQSTVLAAESIEIGARKILDAILEGEDRSQIRSRLQTSLIQDAGGTETALEDETMSLHVLMETFVQEGGAKNLVANMRATYSQQKTKAVSALIAGIVLAAKRLVAANLPKDEVAEISIGFLGQGWHLLDDGLTHGIASEDQIFELLRTQIDRHTVTRLDTGRDPMERKKQVAEGAMIMLRRRLTGVGGGGGGGGTNVSDFQLGMELDLDDGTKLRRDNRASEVGRTPFAAGDPGFEPLIRELLALAQTVPQGVATGDLGGWIEDATGLGDAESRLEKLIKKGCTDLRENFGDQDVAVKRSPLMSFLSGPWSNFWVKGKKA